MRAARLLIAAAVIGGAAALEPEQPASAAPCSVFARHPCTPPGVVGCSVFQRRPCIPEIENPIGQDLRLTIESVSNKEPSPEEPNPSDGSNIATTGSDGSGDPPSANPEHKINTILELYGALRTCWVPPPEDEARPGMQMSVRFSFKRSGEIIGMPRVTYATPGAKPAERDLYHEAITEALARCTPMPFSTGLGGAVAGRPINIRYVDNRKPQ
jgi:hypothetical protein